MQAGRRRCPASSHGTGPLRIRAATPETIRPGSAAGSGRGVGPESRSFVPNRAAQSRELTEERISASDRQFTPRSRGKRRAAAMLRWDEHADVRGDFPLLPLEETLELAAARGIRQPRDRKGSPPRRIMDLLVDYALRLRRVRAGEQPRLAPSLFRILLPEWVRFENSILERLDPFFGTHLPSRAARTTWDMLSRALVERNPPRRAAGSGEARHGRDRRDLRSRLGRVCGEKCSPSRDPSGSAEVRGRIEDGARSTQNHCTRAPSRLHEPGSTRSPFDPKLAPTSIGCAAYGASEYETFNRERDARATTRNEVRHRTAEREKAAVVSVVAERTGGSKGLPPVPGNQASPGAPAPAVAVPVRAKTPCARPAVLEASARGPADRYRKS